MRAPSFRDFVTDLTSSAAGPNFDRRLSNCTAISEPVGIDGIGSRRLSDQCEFPRDSGFSGNGGGRDAIAQWPGSRCSAVGALRDHRLHLTVFPREINPGVLAHLGDV